MKSKIIYLVILCLMGIRCSDDQETNNQYSNYIDIDFTDSDYKNNLQLFIEASKRFDEHVYKDENDVYKTSINKGSDIEISENVFNTLVNTLKYREQVKHLKIEKINLRIDKTEDNILTRSYPIGSYDEWVCGQLNCLWEQIIGTWQAVNQYMIDFFCIMVGVSVLTFIDFFYMPFFGAGLIIHPDDAYNYDPPMAHDRFLTRLPDGLYPSPSSDKEYVAVRNGIAEVKRCNSYYSFSWYRGDIKKYPYYQNADKELILI